VADLLGDDKSFISGAMWDEGAILALDLTRWANANVRKSLQIRALRTSPRHLVQKKKEEQKSAPLEIILSTALLQQRAQRRR